MPLMNLSQQLCISHVFFSNNGCFTSRYECFDAWNEIQFCHQIKNGTFYLRGIKHMKVP